MQANTTMLSQQSWWENKREGLYIMTANNLRNLISTYYIITLEYRHNTLT